MRRPDLHSSYQCIGVQLYAALSLICARLVKAHSFISAISTNADSLLSNRSASLQSTCLALRLNKCPPDAATAFIGMR